MVVVYLLLFSVYWTWSLVRLVVDLRPLLEMRSFCVRKLQLSDRDIQTITWPEVVARVVHLQATTRLCIVRDLNEHDIVARILRKENYLLGMLNRGVLGLTLGVPGLRGKEWLTKAVEWNVYHAVFHNMFDDDFSIRASFYDVSALRARMRFLAVVNLALSPFIALFMMMYFLLHRREVLPRPRKRRPDSGPPARRGASASSTSSRISQNSASRRRTSPRRDTSRISIAGGFDGCQIRVVSRRRVDGVGVGMSRASSTIDCSTPKCSVETCCGTRR